MKLVVAIWPSDFAKPTKARTTKRIVIITISPPPMVDKNSIEFEKWCSTMMKTIKVTKVKRANKELEI